MALQSGLNPRKRTHVDSRTATGYFLVVLGVATGFSVLLHPEVHSANGASFLGIILMFLGLGVLMRRT